MLEATFPHLNEAKCVAAVVNYLAHLTQTIQQWLYYAVELSFQKKEIPSMLKASDLCLNTFVLMLHNHVRS